MSPLGVGIMISFENVSVMFASLMPKVTFVKTGRQVSRILHNTTPIIKVLLFGDGIALT